MENLIEELTKVNPTNLSEEGLKLFNEINEIIDRNRELEEREIWSTATIEGLKEDFIPTSLIKEKIEEYKVKIQKTAYTQERRNRLNCKIQVLEELLKGE